MPASSGKYREPRRQVELPFLTRVIAATLVTGLVIDAIQKNRIELIEIALLRS